MKKAVLLTAVLLGACASQPEKAPSVTIGGVEYTPEDCGQFAVVPAQRPDMRMLDAYLTQESPQGISKALSKQLHGAFVAVPGSKIAKSLNLSSPKDLIEMSRDQRQLLKAYLTQCPATDDTASQPRQDLLSALTWIASRKEPYLDYKARIIKARKEKEKRRRAALLRKKRTQNTKYASDWKLTRSGSCKLRPSYPKTGISFSISEQLGLHVMSLKGKFVSSWLRVDRNKPYKSPYNYQLTRKVQFVTGIQYHVSGYGKGDMKSIIPEMQKGRTLYLSFVNEDGKRYSADFSLMGFTKAYQAYQRCVRREE